MTPITLGTATTSPGTLQYGGWDALNHPTGSTEFLPVILAQGKADGPTIWLTAGIHGPEHAGPSVLYRLLTQELVDQLKGAIVAIPALTPAGLRTKSYIPYHVDINPNRLWPDGKPFKKKDPEKHPPFSLERAYERLFAEITASVDYGNGCYLIDYHNAWIGSLSFSFQDRVLYRADVDAEKNKSDAETLLAKQQEMLEAYGHTIVVEFPAEKYVDLDLHRSTSGAALLAGKIPGFTVELGTGLTPDPDIVRAAVAGTRNVLRWAGMLDGEMEPITGIKLAQPGYRARRTESVRVPYTCIVLSRVEAGDIFHAGEVLAELVDVWGRPVGEGVLPAEHDGFVIGRAHGIYHYEGDTVLHVAIRDEHPLVAPYPEDYFKEKT